MPTFEQSAAPSSGTPHDEAAMIDEEIEIVSQLLKAMSHPIRLKILCLLQDRELTVGEIREQVKTTNANVSQHLGILRNQGIIDFRKDANFIFNFISDKRVVELIRKLYNLFCPAGLK